MGNSKIIIAVVVGIIVLKLIAVHFYLKAKINQSEQNTNASDDKAKDSEQDN
jgi:hypothetical protein